MSNSGFPHLRQLRIDLGMTQEAFAKSIGMNKTTYNNYETGAREPRSDFWEKVAKKYRVTVDFLLGLSDEKSSAPAKVKAEETTVDEKRLLKNYHELNSEGHQKLIDYSDDLVLSGRYTNTSAVEEDA